MSRDPYPHFMFDDSPIDDPAIFTTPKGELIGGGERAVRFIRAMRHPITGKPFELHRPYERMIRRIFGPRHPDGTRVVREVVAMLPRGSRKTTLGAAIASLMAIGPERRRNGQVILAAYNREQSAIAFDEARGLVSDKVNPKIAAAVKVRSYENEIEHIKSGSIIRAIAADAATQNGKTPYLCLFDELHQWKNRKLYDTLRTGLSKTSNSLGLVISQAGRGRDTLAAEVFDFARKVASGEIENEAILPVLFETDPDADIYDEAVWHRANPGLRFGYPDLASFRTAAQEAKERPAMRESFKNDKLNIWLEGKSDPWIETAVFDEGDKGPIDLTKRHGEVAWLGVDLGDTSDLTVIALALRDPDGGFTVVPFTFVPEDTLRPREERGEAPYVRWRDEGFLTSTTGASTDYQLVEEKIRELCRLFSVQEIALDPWSARAMIRRLNDDGLPAFEHRQGFRSFNEPMRDFEKAVLDRKLRHGGHPLLRWCVGNVAIDRDPAGNVKPNKGRSSEKIDAAVAAVMAVGRAAFDSRNFNIHADPDCDPASWYKVDEAA